MIKPGFVRLVAALIAAISLHALIFTLLPGQQESVQLNPFGSLQIELLAQQEIIEELPAKPEKTIAKAAVSSVDAGHYFLRQQPKEIKTQAVPITVVHDKAVAFIAPEKVVATKKLEGAAKAVEPVNIAEVASVNDSLIEKDSTDQHTKPKVAQMNVMPQYIQAKIVARVSYPRQARRHGWQGEAQFLLNINEQVVQKVTMLASTGYPILDRAAQRGLSNVGNIPLSNGLYHMPVSFRLQ